LDNVADRGLATLRPIVPATGCWTFPPRSSSVRRPASEPSGAMRPLRHPPPP